MCPRFAESELQPGDWRLENPGFTEAVIRKNYRLTDDVADIEKEIEPTGSGSPGTAAVSGCRRNAG